MGAYFAFFLSTTLFARDLDLIVGVIFDRSSPSVLSSLRDVRPSRLLAPRSSLSVRPSLSPDGHPP